MRCTTRAISPARPADRAADRRRRSRREWVSRRSDPTRAARSEFPPRRAASWGSSLRSARCRRTAWFRSARRSITSARSRGRSPMRQRCGRCSPGEFRVPSKRPTPADVTLGALGDYFTALLESDVRSAFERAIARLRTSGVGVGQANRRETDAIVDTYVNISLAEAAHWHAATLDSRADDYQPPVRERLERGRTISAVSYLRARDVRRSSHARRRFRARGLRRTCAYRRCRSSRRCSAPLK